MSRSATSGWGLSLHGIEHRVEISGSFSRTVRWYVDGSLVGERKSSEDTVRVKAGDGLPPSEGPSPSAADLGVVGVSFTALGRERRVTWYRPEGGTSATARALLRTGGIDLDPEPGSAAARREERIRRRPRRYAALAVLGGVGQVVLPLLLGLLAVRLTASLPWPDWDLPSVPWPSVDLPSVPWPDVDLPDVTLPDWDAPGWLTWLLDKAKYVGPVLVAGGLAAAELRRRRAQDELKARLRAEAAATRPEPHGPASAARGTDRADDRHAPPSPG